MFARAAAHGMVPLDIWGTAGYGLSLIVAAHSVGWPVVRGGAQRFADALAMHLRSLGGEIVTGQRATSLSQLPASRALPCDVTPKQFLGLAGDRLPAGYRRSLTPIATDRPPSGWTGCSMRLSPGARKSVAVPAPSAWVARSPRSLKVNGTPGMAV